MAKQMLLKRIKTALRLHEMAKQLGPNHPWEEPMLDRAARAMVAYHLHRKPKQGNRTGEAHA